MLGRTDGRTGTLRCFAENSPPPPQFFTFFPSSLLRPVIPKYDGCDTNTTNRNEKFAPRSERARSEVLECNMGQDAGFLGIVWKQDRIYLTACMHFVLVSAPSRPPQWSSGQCSWLLTQMSWLRFSALPDFLSSSGSGTGST
jgi:hypothetical protein